MTCHVRAHLGQSPDCGWRWNPYDSQRYRRGACDLIDVESVDIKPAE